METGAPTCTELLGNSQLVDNGVKYSSPHRQVCQRRVFSDARGSALWNNNNEIMKNHILFFHIKR